MDEPNNNALQKRVAQLENAVSELQSQVWWLNHAAEIADNSVPIAPDRVESLPEVVVSEPVSVPEPEPEPERIEKRPLPPSQSQYLQSEFWLNKIGVGLMLFALAFLFKFAVDQGWLTPAVRVGIGLLIGTGLLLFGLRTYEKRRHFSVGLLGGSMGSYYITGFAAFQLYELVPFPAAFGFMLLVTILTFALSLRQNEATLALIGALGGFGTPFLLYTGSGNVPGLILYTCLLIAGTVGIYFFKGWSVLLWVSSLLGWVIILIGESEVAGETAVSSPQLIVQAAILFAWVAFGGIPLLRRYLTSDGTSSLRPRSIGFADALLPATIKRWLGNGLHLRAVTSALFLAGSSAFLWRFSDSQRGWLFIGIGLFYVVVALFLRRLPAFENLSITHGFAATILLTIACLILLDDEALLLALTAEAIVWHFLSNRLGNRWVQDGTHLFSLMIGFALFARLSEGRAKIGETAVRLFTDVTVILAFAAAAVAWLPRLLRRGYLLAVHVAILMLLWRDLSWLPNGQGLISISWGVYAIALLLVGLRTRFDFLRTVGLATLFILVGKLFLIDLTGVKPIWRILLFFGFGGVFLLLSYFYQGAQKQKPDEL